LGMPISVEWTVLYERAILHLGVHNLPPAEARWLMAVMADYTAHPAGDRLPALLWELAARPHVLIVLNHPFWLEEGVREEDRHRAVTRLLRECPESIHAFELNGTREWWENSATIDLARTWARPVISGGDRHGTEPAACINLTNAGTFADFVSEVRAGQSQVAFMPHYREPMTLRIVEAIWSILRPYPEYRGRERWTDRVFYRNADGQVNSVAELWKDRTPWPVGPAAGLVQFFTAPGFRPALRLLLSRNAEMQP
jgi:hypothetical protein